MPEHDPKTSDDRALRARLDQLSQELAARAKQTAADDAAKSQSDGSMAQAGRAMSLGFRAITELMVGLGVGAAIGWGLDWLIGTKPLLMIIFLFLGMAAGVWNVMRLANAMNTAGDSTLRAHTKAGQRDPGSNGPPQAG